MIHLHYYFIGPRFTVFPDVSGLPPFSHINGFALDPSFTVHTVP